ncbi:hypothetical protein JCM8547_007904 [Rhodosporidiobolus lusitaniae]
MSSPFVDPSSRNVRDSVVEQDEVILNISRATQRGSFHSPLLKSEFGTGGGDIEISREDRQNGYDVSLLALQPRGQGGATSPQPHSQSSSRPTTSYTTHSASTRSSYYPDDDGEGANEVSPLSAAFDPPSAPSSSENHARRPSYASINMPPISTNQRNAAQAYHDRALRSESRLALQRPAALKHESTPSGSSYDVEVVEHEREKAAANLEKRSGRKAGRVGGAANLWKRKKLLFSLVALVLLLCLAVGIGAGVGISKSRKNDLADESSTSSSSSSDSLTSTDTLAPTASSDTASVWSDPSASATASTTDWATVGQWSGTATATTDWATVQPTSAAGAQDGSDGGWWGEDGQYTPGDGSGTTAAGQWRRWRR